MKKLFTLCLYISIFLFLSAPVKTYADDKAKLNGSFIQPWLGGYWSEETWQKEFAAFKEAGMNYLIIGPLIYCTPGEVSKTLYPSSLPNTTLSSNAYGQDLIDKVLRNAESAGIKVFLQISENSQWWTGSSHDTSWLFPQMRLDREVCDEVWSRYKDKYPNAFYGWYFTYEENNADLATTEKRNAFASAINIILDHLTDNNMHLPLMWCPYMNSALGTSDENRQYWADVFSQLHTIDGDIFCPQDCVGAGGLKITEVDEWFSALRKAVDTKPGLHFWSDLETFIQTDWTSATMDRIVKQIEIEQPYVDDFITFAYCHYQSPNNTASGYQETYLDYLKNGKLETTLPSSPANFTAVTDEWGNVTLTWEAPTDNIGVCGYYVYRNGEQIWKKQIGRLDGAASIAPLPTMLADGVLEPETEYTYEIAAYDYAGNLSVPANAVIKTAAFSYLENIISLGCPYTVSYPADAGYPDTGNKELTNGGFGRTLSKKDPAYEGVYDAYKTTRHIIIDLNESKPVQQFVAYYLLDRQSSIFLPSRIAVAVSADNTTFTGIGDMSIPIIPLSVSVALCNCLLTIDEPVNARYVRFSVVPSGSWTFANEYEVRNNNTSGVEEKTGQPKEFLLQQNYPNPFNPGTTIKYALPEASFVKLVVYNSLGEVVRTLVNDNRSAGYYEIVFDAKGLASGIYICRLEAGSYVSSAKMLLLK
jgi:hypothetical protein